MFDGAIEFNHPDVVCKNGAIWHNTFTNCLNAIRFTVLSNGPVWVIGNDGRGDCGYFFQVYISGGATNYGWKLIYNNTFITTTKLQIPPATNSAACQTLGSGAGRVVAVNNILQGPEDYIGSLDDAIFPAVNIFTKNAFFVPSPGTKRWIFDGVPVNPNTEARYLEVAGSAVSFSGNIYDVEPYPNGIDGELATGLAGKADSIAGITNIAADETGTAQSEPLNLGYFPKWKS
jgi:hypothetical protein